MTTIIGQGHLFVFMEPTSPRGHDLQRDGRYAIHCAVNDTSGESGEFIITGQAHLVNDADQRALAAKLASYTPKDRYILFEFDVESASSTIYPSDQPVRQFWKPAKEQHDIRQPGNRPKGYESYEGALTQLAWRPDKRSRSDESLLQRRLES